MTIIRLEESLSQMMDEAAPFTLPDHEALATSRAWESSGKPEIQQLQWNPFALKCVNDLGETGEAVEKERKSASWKAAVAAYLMERTQADNAWLAGGLHMDSTNATSH